MILGLGVLQLNTLIDGLIAGLPVWLDTAAYGIDYPLDDGSLAALNYAQRLYNFPLGVFGIAVATAIYPLLTSRAGDGAAFLDTARRGVRLVLFISIPAGIGLILLRKPITVAILEGGLFDATDTDRVAFVLLGYATSIWAYMLGQILTRTFYARGEEKTPVRIGLAMVSLNLVLNLILIWPLKEAGLAWSTAVCATLQTIIMLVLLSRRGVPIFDREVTRSAVVSLGGGLLMGVCIALAARWWPVPESWIGGAGRLLGLTVLGGGLVLLWSWRIRQPEWRWALGMQGADSPKQPSKTQT